MRDHALDCKLLKLVVLISGSGSNLQSIIDAIDSGSLNAKICAVISNEKNAYGLQRARRSSIDTAVLSHLDYAGRRQHEQALSEYIDRYRPDLIILAGYMRILSAWFVRKYTDMILNIHPSLLPKFKGTNTHQRALDAGETEHGASVHLVTEELDGGPVVIKAEVPIEPDDNPEILRDRVLAKEHVIYPEAIRWFSTGKVRAERSKLIFS
jgi:phosphoribosylglycinamide formyltransferase-1